MSKLQTYHMIPVAVVMTILIMGFQNCSVTKSDETTGEQINAVNSQKYFQSTPKVVVEVFYEPGAEPFTGNSIQGTPYWNILEENLHAIFQYRTSQPVVIVPKALSAMTAIPSQARTEWTGMDLVDLNARTAPAVPDGESHFQVYFLKGYYSTGSGPQTSIIGVSLSGTTVVGIFKQVIENSGSNPNGPVPKFVEQSTLVHELGHALGFVNNGVPLTSSYQDIAHGAHSSNTECVMYWQNEGASGLSTFVQKYLTSSSRVMWGPEVLNDAKALSR